ncbi:vWA domain-containing protein [Roseovarius sp.]|uniref:vWA domain-containing protein n=1 Tax=Roseovarius sp. TaxID=1486281 RepID=UPI003B5B52B5
MKRALLTTLTVLASALPVAPRAVAQECSRDAMLVFDGSASMAELGFDQTAPTRIEDARTALRRALPGIAPVRRVGLLTYGPGPEGSCDGINLKFAPVADAAQPILDAIDLMDPIGLTPLTEAVAEAARVLNHTTTPGIIVLVTDGNETCGGRPCALGADLAARSANLTVHVIGFRVVADPFAWDSPEAGIYTDGSSIARCISDQTGGMYVATDTVDELTEALRKTLGCALIG